MTDDMPAKPDRFAAARAAKALKASRKQALDDAEGEGLHADPETGEIDPAPVSAPANNRWANDISAAVTDAPQARWGTLDLTVQPTLPKPGWYRAEVCEVRTYDRPDVLWFSVRVKLAGCAADPSPIMEPLAADPKSRHAPRVVEGRRLLNRLAAATGVPATGAYETYGDMYEGRSLWARVAIVPRDGVDGLVLRSLADRNPETGEA